MNPMLELAEARIGEAMANGDLDDLPGAGRPLALDDDSMVPEELRTAYRMLKNAGYLPPELDDRREIRRLEDLLAGVSEDAPEPAAADARRRLVALRSRVEQQRGRGPLWADPDYQQRVLKRLERQR